MEAISNGKKLQTIKYNVINESHKSFAYQDYRQQWDKNPKKNIVNRFPIHLDIELNSHCNLRCIMCFQSFAPPAKGLMSWKLYTKLIDEGAKKGLRAIKLQYRGEPLLYPKIVEAVEYAKKKGIIDVMFNTNANLLTEDMSQKLIKAGLDKLICSVDGYNKQFYEKIRRGGKWNTVLKNIKQMQKLKQELNSKTPDVRVQMLKFDWIKNGAQHVKEYIEFWKTIVDDIGVDYCNDYDYSKINDILICSDFKCSSPWQRLFIMWDGQVRLCCGDIYGQYPLGNAKKDSIEKIWKSAKVKYARETNRTGRSHLLEICNSCGGRRTTIINNGLIYTKVKEN